MITKQAVSIELQNVSLVYDLHHDRTNNFKEIVINFLTRRKYVEKRKDTISALSGVNISIAQGERVGIVGLNGAGKSTLLKVIAGILKPTTGSLNVMGTIQPLIEVGAGFDPEFTGRENIYLNSYMLGFNKKQVQEREAEIIAFSELGDFINTPIKYYSSGMIVRLAFSIATMVSPEILVFDEMLSAGDVTFIQKAQDRINNLINQAKILVVVSHDLNLINNICNRCIVISGGKVSFDGKVPEAIQFYLDSANKKLT